VEFFNRVIAPMMEAASTSETSVRRNNQEESHFHSRGRENFTSLVEEFLHHLQ
jgi:hypothetical protein